MKPIGIVRSCYIDKFGTPRQPGLAPDARAFLEINKQVQPEFSLEGLAEFSHLWVIFLFHKNSSEKFHAKVHPPRLGGETIGVFASRSPHRPNPIGLSLVKIEKVEANGVWVTGVDLIEGTPILDIKPYLPEVESIPNAKSGWTKNITKNDIEVHWLDITKSIVSEYQEKTNRSNLPELIEQTLKLDPRPNVYKGYEGESSPYRESHAVRFYDLDVHFRFVDASTIEIFEIRLTSF